MHAGIVKTGGSIDKWELESDEPGYFVLLRVNQNG